MANLNLKGSTYFLYPVNTRNKFHISAHRCIILYLFKYVFAGISQAAKKVPLKYFAREIIKDKRIVFTGKNILLFLLAITVTERVPLTYFFRFRIKLFGSSNI